MYIGQYLYTQNMDLVYLNNAEQMDEIEQKPYNFSNRVLFH